MSNPEMVPAWGSYTKDLRFSSIPERWEAYMADTWPRDREIEAQAFYRREALASIGRFGYPDPNRVAKIKFRSRIMSEIVAPVAAWLAAMIFIGHIAYFSLLLLRWWILKEAS